MCANIPFTVGTLQCLPMSRVTGSPAATASPALAVIWKTTPVIWALTSSVIERSLFDHLGVNRAGAKRGALHDVPVGRDHSLDALDAFVVEEDARQQGIRRGAPRPRPRRQ